MYLPPAAMGSETDTRKWSTITCECGATTTIDPAAIYHTICAIRLRRDPDT